MRKQEQNWVRPVAMRNANDESLDTTFVAGWPDG